MIVVLLMSITIASCSGDEPSNGSGDNTSTKEGSIYGLVTNSETAEPVRGADVKLHAHIQGSGYTKLVSSVVTYDDGHFEFQNLSPGLYEVTVTNDRYKNFSQELEVKPGQISKVDLKLTYIPDNLSVITKGYDMDSDYLRLLGAFNSRGAYGVDEYGFYFGTEPNPNKTGKKYQVYSSSYSFYVDIRLSDLSSSTYYFQAFAKNKYQEVYGEVFSVTIKDSSSLYGTIVEAISGEPISYASITLSPGGITQYSDSHGLYGFSNIEPMQYTITVQKSGYRTNRKLVTVISGKATVADVTLSKVDDYE